MLKPTLAAAAVLSFTVMSGCSRSHTVTTHDGSVTYEQNKNGDQTSVHAVGKDGSTVDLNTGKDITDYPGDVPLYKGKTSTDIKSNEKHTRMVIVQTGDSMDKVSGFYKSELEGKGWKVENSVSTPNMVLYEASKGNHDLVVQLGGDNSSGTTISQTITDK